VKAYVTIIEGCNDHCAFCVVPHTRGHERMRSKADILADVRDAVRSGRKEIQLLGQIVNHYAAPDDPSCEFADLLAHVNDIDGVAVSALRVRTRGTPVRGSLRQSVICRRSASISICPCSRARPGFCARCGGGTRERNTWISSSVSGSRFRM
jgi:hypothetical protein